VPSGANRDDVLRGPRSIGLAAPFNASRFSNGFNTSANFLVAILAYCRSFAAQLLQLSELDRIMSYSIRKGKPAASSDNALNVLAGAHAVSEVGALSRFDWGGSVGKHKQCDDN